MNNTINRELTLQKLKEGVDTLANVVKKTAGSQGGLVLLGKKDSKPVVTKDGVSVARMVECNDPVANLGCSLLKQAAELTVEQAGDGTTLTVILSQIIFDLLSKNESTDKRKLLKEIEDSTHKVVELLYASAKQVSSIEDCIAIATISANGDSDIGELVGEVVWLARENGVIQLEKWDNDFTEPFQEKGSRYNRPYEYKPLLGSKQIKIAYNDPHIVVLDYELDSLQEIANYVKESQELGKPLVIFARDFSNIVIGNLVHNYQKAGLKVLPLVIPGYGDEKKEYYEDIVALAQQDNINRVVADKLGFTIFTNEVTQEMSNRIEFLEAQITQEESDYAREILETRLSTLCQKVFTINVGATSEVERDELYDRVEDAILATRCATEEGYVLGGGLALRNISKQLGSSKGDKIISKACMAGYLQILENAGLKEPNDYKDEEGINTSTGKLENFYESRIIDPVKVIASAIINAVSVTKSMLSIQGSVIENPNANLRPVFKEGFGWVEE